MDAVPETGLDAGREGDGHPGLARAAGSGQRQQPGAVEEAASRAEFTLPADEARPRPWHATGRLAGVRGPETHHLSSPPAVTHGRRRSAPAPAGSMVSPIPARAPSGRAGRPARGDQMMLRSGRGIDAANRSALRLPTSMHGGRSR